MTAGADCGAHQEVICYRFATPRSVSRISVARLDANACAMATIALVANPSRAAALTALIRDRGTAIVNRTPDPSGRLETRTWERPDVVIIDPCVLRRPDRVVKRLRQRWPTLNVAIVDARDHGDVVTLLDAGADEVIVAGSLELRSCLRAIRRRAQRLNAGARVAIGDVVFDREAQRVWCAGAEVFLTRRELAVVDCLFWHSPEPVSRKALAGFVWGNPAVARDSTLVDVYIGSVRRKFRGSRSVVLRTVRGIGYRFAVDGDGS